MSLYYNDSTPNLTPGEQAVNDLAASLYKDKRHINGLLKIFEQITPKVKDDEIELFCKHWLHNCDYSGRFPLIHDVKRFLDNLESRKNKQTKDLCGSLICDSSGYIELKLKGTKNERNYIYRKWCKCINKMLYKEAMQSYELTHWQKNYHITQDQLAKK